jgi:hypothetical protein
VIIRIFRPTIHPGKDSEFESFLRNTAIPLVAQQTRAPLPRPSRDRNHAVGELTAVTDRLNLAKVPTPESALDPPGQYQQQ